MINATELLGELGVPIVYFLVKFTGCKTYITVSNLANYLLVAVWWALRLRQKYNTADYVMNVYKTETVN